MSFGFRRVECAPFSPITEGKQIRASIPGELQARKNISISQNGVTRRDL